MPELNQTGPEKKQIRQANNQQEQKQVTQDYSREHAPSDSATPANAPLAVKLATDREPTRARTATPLAAITFTDDRHGWITGADGVLLRTADGGETWWAQNPPLETSVHLHAIAFARGDARVGWIVGNAATIFATTDRGAT